jgi:hypothetical protein
MSMKPLPNCSLISAMVLICAEFVMPFGMRTRIMKRPGVCLRKKTPAHFRRSRSPSVIASHPSAAYLGTSARISRPSFSLLYSSILFIASPRKNQSCPVARASSPRFDRDDATL